MMKTHHPETLPARLMTASPSIADFYSNYDEGSRLDTTAQGRLERERIRNLLSRHLPPPPAKVLDIGGAEGIHSAWMVHKGWDVELFDLTEKHVQAAAALNLFPASVADARDIPLPDAYADGIAFLGPLYHLCEREDRLAALKEAYRLLRDGGSITAAAIARYKFIYSPYRDRPASRLLEFVNDITQAEGRVTWGGAGHDSFYHLPHELEQEMLEAGFRDVKIVAVEAFGWPLGWEPDPDVLELIAAMETTPTAYASTFHLAALAVK